MKLEENILHYAINTLNREILTSITYKQFLEPSCRLIAKYVLYLYNAQKSLTYDTIRKKINDERQYVSQLHAKLNEIENDTFYYLPELIQELEKRYHENAVKKCAQKMVKIGTTECNLVEAKDLVFKLADVFKNIEEDKKHFGTLIEAAHDIVNTSVEKLSETIIEMPNPIMRTIFGHYMLPRFYIVGGLPSMGKNFLVDRLIADILPKNKIIYFSYDNSRMETAYMILSMLTGIPYSRIELHALEENEKQVIESKKNLFERIYITSNRVNIDKIRVILEKLKLDPYWKDYNMFIIDYFQSIPLRNDKEVVREYEHAAREINKICNDLQITGLILSQSNDKSRQQDLKFTLNDLKWCSALGQDSFYVVGMEGERESRKRTVRIVKNKRGSLGQIEIEFNFTNNTILQWEPRG